MAKRKNDWDEKKIARYIKEGRGQGELSNYKPWLTIQNVPSCGRVHRLNGWTTGRIHHLLSDLEHNYFCLLDWSDEVIDIREQFPLDREITTTIADKIGIKHPEDSITKTPLVMTTDFFITLRTDKQVLYLARTIKPSTHLNDARVIEKFEIERIYWEQKNVDWGIVTEKEFNKEMIDNIKWIHSSYDLQGTIDSSLIHLFLNSFEQSIPLTKLLNNFDNDYNLTHGTALAIFKHLLANKGIKLDIRKKVDLTLPASDFSFNSNTIEIVRYAT